MSACLMAGASDPVISWSNEELPPRSNLRAAAQDLHANRMRLAVTILWIRFHADQVIAGELRLDALEETLGLSDHVEDRPPCRAGEHLEPFDPGPPIADRVTCYARVAGVEDRVVEPQDVQARPRRRGERSKLHHKRGVREHEPLRHEDQGFGAFDIAQTGEQ